jgi:L-iditol 2-dehydrogenase
MQRIAGGSVTSRTETMKAAVLHGVKDLRVESVQRPEPLTGQCLVRIQANGLCGSDIHFYEDGKLGPFVVDDPYIPGHEAVGTIVQADPESRSLSVGDRVVIEPGIPCRKCDYCHRGLYNLCPNVVFLSAPPINGTFAEYACVDSDFLYRVPPELTNEEAALVEPVSVGIHACNRAVLRPGSSVVIIGAGPIGLITSMVARAYGAAHITVVDIRDSRLQKASELGADAVVNPTAGGDAAAAIMELTDGRGADYVFEASGSTAGCSLAPNVAARGGSVTLIGWPELSEFPFAVEQIIEKELNIFGVNRYRNTFRPALDLMAARRIDVRPLVSHRFSFDNVVEAFEFASENRSVTTKVVVLNEDETK